MAIHGMIDIETLDVKPTAVVLSVGAYKFDPYTSNSPYDMFYRKILIDDQDALNRTIGETTMEWWSKQDPVILEEAMDQTDGVTVMEFTKELRKWLVGVDKLWGHGYGFDYTIIENMFNSVDAHAPWSVYDIRDSRTLFTLMPTDPRTPMQQNLHKASDDAYYQAKAVQITYNYLMGQGITPR